MKPQAWVIVVVAVMTAGCAVSEKTPSSSDIAGASANRQRVPASDEPAAPPADDDFALLEDELVERAVEVADPLEPWNRTMYQANDILYFWVVKPCVQIYKGIAPEPVRIGVRNFFNNLSTPVRLVNCLLQGKGDSAGTELRRFGVNTTAGILGFGDPAADKLGLQPADEDLGQTLAVYGLRNGFYIVWPFFGPSTVWDTVGMVGDRFLNPTHYVEPVEASIGISALKGANAGSFHIGQYEALKSASIDPYVAMREIYVQYRDKQIRE